MGRKEELESPGLEKEGESPREGPRDFEPENEGPESRNPEDERGEENEPEEKDEPEEELEARDPELAPELFEEPPPLDLDEPLSAKTSAGSPARAGIKMAMRQMRLSMAPNLSRRRSGRRLGGTKARGPRPGGKKTRRSHYRP
jgi:hypothetical protein